MAKKKEEFEELFNKVFGTSIRWSKLSLEELTQLATVLANPDSLIKRLRSLSPQAEDEAVELVESLRRVVGKIKHRGPIVNLLKALLGVEREGERGVEEK